MIQRKVFIVLAIVTVATCRPGLEERTRNEEKQQVAPGAIWAREKREADSQPDAAVAPGAIWDRKKRETFYFYLATLTRLLMMNKEKRQVAPGAIWARKKREADSQPDAAVAPGAIWA